MASADSVLEADQAAGVAADEVDPELALARCCAYAVSRPQISVNALLGCARRAFRLERIAITGPRSRPPLGFDASRMAYLSVLPLKPWHRPLEVAWGGSADATFAFMHALRGVAELASLVAAVPEIGRRRARVMDLIAAPTALVDAGGRIRSVNDAWHRRDMAQLAAAGVALRVGGDYLDGLEWSGDERNHALAAAMRRVLSARSDHHQHEYERESRDGRRWVALDLVAIPRGGGALVLHRDLTLHRSDRLQGMAVKQARAQATEHERRRIAQDIHDDIVQRLALTAIALEDVHPTSREASSRIDLLKTGLRDIIADLRSLSHRIHPPTLRRRGLVLAIHELGRSFSEAYGLAVVVTADPLRAIPEETALTLYRVVEEALANAAKHSGASRTRINLRCAERALRLTITDDGKGFPASGMRRGFGIESMRSRMAEIGGALAISSGPLGTQVAAVCPLGAEPARGGHGP